jgi:hypothetical protein
MQREIFKILLLVPLSFLLSNCNDSLNLNMPEPDDRIVIDGWIDKGQFAKVLLTRNTAYFSSIDSESIRSLVLTRAKVTLSDGENSEILILRRNNDYFPPYVFEGNEIVGDTGKIYTITAEYGGKTAWASTTIPAPVSLDSLYFQLAPASDSLGTIYIEFTDPPDIKNYYRILSRRINQDKRYTSPMVMGIDDIFFSGRKFGFSLNRGPNSYLSSKGNNYFKIGDTVSIKFCTIDKAQYDFWNSFQDEVLNTSNPFASSMSSVLSNVQGDGLGVFGGYGVSMYTITIK